MGFLRQAVPVLGCRHNDLERAVGIEDGTSEQLVGEVFTNLARGPLRRSMFRTRVWRPSLVRAGLLGKVIEHESRFHAEWQDESGHAYTDKFTTYAAAVKRVACAAAGGVRFHDLRHSYAIWLVSDGVPVNIVQRLMGHEKASTTLDRYTYVSRGWDSRVRESFADFPSPSPWSL